MKPDHEFTVMRKGLEQLQKLSPDGRRRVINYWHARIGDMPTPEQDYGAQQLDIEDAIVASKTNGMSAETPSAA